MLGILLLRCNIGIGCALIREGIRLPAFETQRPVAANRYPGAAARVIFRPARLSGNARLP